MIYLRWGISMNKTTVILTVGMTAINLMIWFSLKIFTRERSIWSNPHRCWFELEIVKKVGQMLKENVIWPPTTNKDKHVTFINNYRKFLWSLQRYCRAFHYPTLSCSLMALSNQTSQLFGKLTEDQHSTCCNPFCFWYCHLVVLAGTFHALDSELPSNSRNFCLFMIFLVTSYDKLNEKNC